MGAVTRAARKSLGESRVAPPQREAGPPWSIGTERERQREREFGRERVVALTKWAVLACA